MGILHVNGKIAGKLAMLLPIIAEGICRDGSCVDKFEKSAPLLTDPPVVDGMRASPDL